MSMLFMTKSRPNCIASNGIFTVPLAVNTMTGSSGDGCFTWSAHPARQIRHHQVHHEHIRLKVRRRLKASLPIQPSAPYP